MRFLLQAVGDEYSNKDADTARIIIIIIYTTTNNNSIIMYDIRSTLAIV